MLKACGLGGIQINILRFIFMLQWDFKYQEDLALLLTQIYKRNVNSTGMYSMTAALSKNVLPSPESIVWF